MEQQGQAGGTTETSTNHELQLLRVEIRGLSSEIKKLNEALILNFKTSVVPATPTILPQKKIASRKHLWIIGVLYILGITIGVLFIVLHVKK